MKRATLAAASMTIVLAGSSGVPEPAVWDEPANYTYELTRAARESAEGSWAITVRDHVVVAVVLLDLEFGERFEPQFKNTPTLADLVADFNRELARDPECSSITFDPATGAPSDIDLDWCSAHLDGGASYTIDAFTPVG